MTAASNPAAELTRSERELLEEVVGWDNLFEVVGEIVAARLAAGEAATECECPPCPGRGNDGHGLTHCAECCFGTGVDADITCPIHGERAYAAPAPTEDATVQQVEAVLDAVERDGRARTLDGKLAVSRAADTAPTEDASKSACSACNDCYGLSIGPDTDGDPCPWCRVCGCHEANHPALSRAADTAAEEPRTEAHIKAEALREFAHSCWKTENDALTQEARLFARAYARRAEEWADRLSPADEEAGS